MQPANRLRATNLAETHAAGRDAGERPVRESTRPAPATLTVESLRAQLVREIGSALYERYFTTHVRLTVLDDRLVVLVPTHFEADLFRRRFDEVLRRLARGRRVEFGVDRGAFEAPRPSSPTPGALPKATPIHRPVETTRYRFDNFVVGRSNHVAHAACQRVAEDDASVPPVFIHGGSGLGKTHLLRACAARFAEKHAGAVVRYATAEQFTNDFVQAVRAGRVEQFRRNFRRADLLCIDDVHFFAGKGGTQGELLHTLDAVMIEGGRIVLASDQHPREVSSLSERLVSRFLAMAVVRIDLPDPALRVKLVRHLASRRGLDIDDAAAELLAERSGRGAAIPPGFGGSVREIEGLLNQVDAVARLLPDLGGPGGRIGAMLVRKALGLDESSRQSGGSALRRPLTPETIVAEVCRELSVDLGDFVGKGRHKRVVLARSLVSSLSRKLTTMSFPEIARAMGRSNHSTIITAQKRLDRLLSEEAGRPLPAEVAGPYAGCTLREVYDALMKKIQG
jgi:chromosomal replication initiator protein